MRPHPHRSARAALALAVLLALLTLPGAVVPDASAALGHCVRGRGGGQLGFSPGAGYRYLPADQLEAQLAATARLGVRWVRLDLDWSVIEPVRGRWDWAATDRTVAAASRHGLRVLGLLSYAPAWARGSGTDSHAAPSDPGAFARFAATAARRYGDRVQAWEVWNEPNLASFWAPRADPAGYARLLRRTTTALRGASNGLVLSGGLAPAVSESGDLAPADFLAAVYAADPHPALDAVADHPYSYPLLPSDPVAYNSFQQLATVRSVMVRHGDAGKQIWLTEFGAPTGSGVGAVDATRQAAILRNGLRQVSRRSWLGPVFVYSLRDSGRDVTDREQNFGVETVDGHAKPARDVVMAAAGGRRCL